jgi:hypothetical protein
VVASPAAVPTGAAGLAAVREAVEVQVAEVRAGGEARATLAAGRVLRAAHPVVVAAMLLHVQSKDAKEERHQVYSNAFVGLLKGKSTWLLMACIFL